MSSLSTVQNILLRLSLRLSLNVVLPRQSDHLVRPFDERMAEPFQPWFVSQMPWHR